MEQAVHGDDCFGPVVDGFDVHDAGADVHRGYGNHQRRTVVGGGGASVRVWRAGSACIPKGTRNVSKMETYTNENLRSRSPQPQYEGRNCIRNRVPCEYCSAGEL